LHQCGDGAKLTPIVAYLAVKINLHKVNAAATTVLLMKKPCLCNVFGWIVFYVPTKRQHNIGHTGEGF